jgi:hypothetical protein
LNVSRGTMKALLINPYIYDISAYSFWSAPLGLLSIGSILRENGIEIELIDCLTVQEGKRKADGRAPFIKERAAAPPGMQGIRKRYRRYGISRENLLERLRGVRPPDLVLITSVMTYWYTGTYEAVRLARAVFPKSKIIVGGIYPSLCKEHAALTLKDADLIVGAGEEPSFFGFVEAQLSHPLPFRADRGGSALPYPCFDLYETIHFIPLDRKSVV